VTRFKLLAVDVDGTLLGSDQRISERNGRALRAARRAGLAVCLCTGRSVAETLNVWSACRLSEADAALDPLICIGGALVCEAQTSRTLHMEPMTAAAAIAGSDACRRLGLSTVALVDSWRWGFDYYLVPAEDVNEVQTRWLDRHECRVRTVQSLAEVDDLPEILRLTILAAGDSADRVEQALHGSCNGQLRTERLFAPNNRIHLIEAFAPTADKWAGVRYVAQGLGIARRDIAAVGDDVNDLAMIAKAGLGVAMAGAPEPVRRAASHVAGENDDDGLGRFIEQMLDGAFD